MKEWPRIKTKIGGMRRIYSKELRTCLDRFCSRSDRVDDERAKEELLGKYLNILTKP